jgi:ParB family chromosome partitioning protein
LTTPDPNALAEQVVRRGLNVRQTEALAAMAGKPQAPERGAAPPDPETVALERSLSAHLGLHVAIRHLGPGGQVTLRYSDLDQLDGLIRLLRGGD